MGFVLVDDVKLEVLIGGFNGFPVSVLIFYWLLGQQYSGTVSFLVRLEFVSALEGQACFPGPLSFVFCVLNCPMRNRINFSLNVFAQQRYF